MTHHDLLPFPAGERPAASAPAERFRAAFLREASLRGFLPMHADPSRAGGDPLLGALEAVEETGAVRNRSECDFASFAPSAPGGPVAVAVRIRAASEWELLELARLGAAVCARLGAGAARLTAPSGHALHGAARELPASFREALALGEAPVSAEPFRAAVAGVLADGAVVFEAGSLGHLLERPGSKGAAALGLRMRMPAPAPEPPPAPRALVAYFDEAVLPEAFALAEELRAAGVPVLFVAGAKNVAKQLREADRLGATLVVLLGGHEWGRGAVALRDRLAETEREVPLGAVAGELLRAVSASTMDVG
ncbi:MAG: His/Gly/Thr/Pro-type tRNA ligase C-terminal domain-containing protein [Candidatus Sumerlaeia bacterium]|nr:His/Gly/Thr/Pro-type tRNA ligase C-terminal domain-containing protein [Candidatus Sumerlaeia bacterium]